MKTLSVELARRLEKVRGERVSLETRLVKLAELEQAINLLMQEEALLIKEMQLSLVPLKAINGKKASDQTDLSQFITKVLADGKPRSLTEIAEVARTNNINFDDKKPKRVLHFALIGLKRNGYSRMVEPSVWQLTEKGISRELDNSRRESEGKQETTTVAG